MVISSMSHHSDNIPVLPVCAVCDCVNGVCNKGPDGDGQCLCQPPYSGTRCDQGKTPGADGGPDDVDLGSDL